MNRAGYCWRCEAPCTQRCSRCRIAFYCSKVCQKQDKWRHEPECDAAALKRECMGCHKEQEGMLKCTACMKAWYCNTECQGKDRKNHKKFCCDIVKKTIHLATEINHFLTTAGKEPGVAWTYYWGNTPAVDLINLSMNEGEEYSSPLALLLCGVGDPRNVLLTIASLPDAYKQHVTFVLNDICPCTLARTVLLLFMLNKGGEAVDAVIRVWYSLRISERDFSQLMSALEELVAARDLKTVTSDFMNVADPGQLNELKRVWRTWIELSKQKGRRVTEMRNTAFEGDGEVENVMRNYLMAIPPNHRESVKLWRADGIFTSQCEVSSSLTRENMTFTGSSFKFENSKGDYNFSPRPCVLPFQGWDYQEVRKTSFDDSLPKMYGVYLSNILRKCVERLSRSEVKLHIVLSNCLRIEPFLPSGLSYDRISTSNLCDYISFTTMLTQFKAYLNPKNSQSILITETINWQVIFFPEIGKKILSSFNDSRFIQAVLRDTENPSLLQAGLLSFREYHNVIPQFQLYLRAALIESPSDSEFSSLEKGNKLPSIKAMATALGLKLRDYTRNENKVFPFKWAVNCRRVTRTKGFEFALEWKLPTPTQ